MKRLNYLGSLLVLLASLSLSATDASPGEVRNVEIFSAKGEVRVEITLSTTVVPSAETAQNPDRLVVKLPGTTSEPRQKRFSVEKFGVLRVRYGLHHPDPPETDLVVDLDEEHPYTMTTDGAKIILLIQPSLRESARQRNAPAGAASKPLINTLAGKSDDSTLTNSQTSAQGTLLTPPPSGPPIQFAQSSSTPSSSPASTRASSEPPSARHPNRASLQEGTVFPSEGAPGAGVVPPVTNTPQQSDLVAAAQSSTRAKVAPASVQPSTLPPQPKLSASASPEPPTSVPPSTVSPGQEVAEKSGSVAVVTPPTSPSPVAQPAVPATTPNTTVPAPTPALPPDLALMTPRPAAVDLPAPAPPTPQPNMAAMTPRSATVALPAPVPPAPQDFAVMTPKPALVGLPYPELPAPEPDLLPAGAETAPDTAVAEIAPEQAETERPTRATVGRVPQLILRKGENPDFQTAFHVKFVAQDTAYLDGGRSVGLAEGMKLVIRDLPNAGAVAAEGADSSAAGDVAELEVLSVAENSAITEIHTPKRPVKVGDLAYLSSADQQALVEKTTLSATRKYPAVVSFTENDTLDEEARAAIPKPPSPAVNRSRGRIGLNYIGVLDHGVSNMYTNELGLVLRTDVTRIGGTYWNASGYWNGRFTHTNGTSPRTLQDLINRTYTLYTSYENPNSSWVAGFGRLYLPYATSLDTLDGGYAGRKLKQGVTTGIFLGSTPDPTSYSYAPNRQMGGAFVNFQGGSYEELHYTSTIGAGMQMLSWAPDRPFVFVENGIYYKRVFSIYQAAQIDSHSAHTFTYPDSVTNSPTTYVQPAVNWGLGRSFTTVRFSPHPRIEFNVNHTYYRDLPYVDPSSISSSGIAAGLFDKFLSQGTMGGVRVEVLKQIWLSADLGLSSHSGDTKSSLNQMFGIGFGHLPWVNGHLDARYSRFNSGFGSGNYEALAYTRNLSEGLQLQLLAGQQNFASSLTSADRSRFVNGMLESNLGRHYFVQAGGTMSRGNEMNYDQWIFTFGYRFDNRAGQKAK